MIGVLVFPSFQLLDAAGPISVFEVARRYAPKLPEVQIFAPEGGAVRSSSGAEMLAQSIRSAGSLSTLIVAGGEDVNGALRSDLLSDFARRSAQAGARVASVCSGAFILAQAGLLDGCQATTHWSCTTDFARRFPKVRVKPDRIFTRDGRIWTSAGISAGIDLALAIVAEDHGEQVARDTARQLVLYHRRSGGQTQFSSLLDLKATSGRFGILLSWVREHLETRLTVESVAERAGMSPRHFARAFAAEIGTTPAKAIEALRLEVARERVQFSSESIDHIARATGFDDAERMRRAFIRVFGQPPQSLRRVARLTG